MKNSLDELFQSEENHKESVYQEFDKWKRAVNIAVHNSEAYVESGSYDDQDAFIPQGAMWKARKNRQLVESMIQKLYGRPYFAHIELKEHGYSISEHFYLSDNESLEQVLQIGIDGYLIPFKQDRNRPITSALFHCYQSKKSEDIRYIGNDGRPIIFSTLLICDDEIRNRELRNVMQLFPEQDLLSVNADELLEQILQENRSNPALRNIIATLQQQQFRIIETDADKSFVVQGCAGSGKSQCLFHRLFFLRDTLSEDGWNHVLLITPTQLFRNYSADLIKRYQLSDINDLSISELYRTLLNVYDPRFRNRHYQFELSEEYLPDGYLKMVYSNETINQIDAEIENAVTKYVQAGCKALGIPMLEEFSASDISRLVEQLESAVEAFDDRESALQQDPEYNKHREQYEKARKDYDASQSTLARLTKEYDQIEEDEGQIRELFETWKDAENERTEWIEQRKKRVETAWKAVARLDKLDDRGMDIDAPAQYMHQLYTFRDLTEGDTFTADEEYLRFLEDEYCAQAKRELDDKIGDQTTDHYINRLEKRKKTLTKRIETIVYESEQLNQIVSEHEKWLRDKAADYSGEQSSQTLRRAEMERARYFLSRIESSVFEQEVWKALAPQKEQFSIQTVNIENLDDGRKRETRILYKSDLLFYIKIYLRLHGNAALPAYSLLCIDEGQDLHPVDYELLQKLFPGAALNVFGDTDQVLHTACGIKDWKKESGINTLFSLDRNYRNEAGIVEFCNRKLGSNMKYVGKVRKEQIPKELHSIREIIPLLNEEKIAVIVKDRMSYERLCKMVGAWGQLEYLDTHASAIPADKIPCYSIFAAKGLEFPVVLVISDDMTQNQRIVACTRATERLYYYE